MDFLINLDKTDFLEEICQIPAKEVLVQSDQFSRVGGLSMSELDQVFDKLQNAGKKVVFAWDHLIKDGEIEKLVQQLTPYLERIDAVRVLDPGLGAHLKARLPNLKLHLSLEHGSFNALAISGWVEALRPQIERVVLSPQIPLKMISAINRSVSANVEIQVFGDLEMFYSRRKLLPSEELEHPVIFSDDRPTQKNRVVQTSSGTIVYYDRQLNLIPHLKEISREGISNARMECYTATQLKQIQSFFDGSWNGDLRPDPVAPVRETTGFFEKNLSDKLFVNLTNRHLSDEAENKIGSVLDSAKNEYTVILLQSEVDLPCTLHILSPEGKRLTWEIESLTDLKQETVKGSAEAGIYRLPWIKFAVPGSLISL